MPHLPTGPPPSLVQGQEPGFSSSDATPSTPQPFSSKSQLCLSSQGKTSPNTHTYIVPTQVPTDTTWQQE